MTWENDYLDDLAMTGKRINTDFGEVEKERYLWLVNAPHPSLHSFLLELAMYIRLKRL